MNLLWSGAPNLPQLPFGRLFRRLDRPVPPNAQIVTAYTDGQVTLRSNRAKIGYHEAADLSGFKGVEVGDFVVHGLDILRGSVGIADSAGAISAVCTICQPTSPLDLRYVAHAIRVQAQSGFTKALARGIREGGADFRRWGTLAELPIPVPNLDYQIAVCDYIDRETGRIDMLIEEQERLVEMLHERRWAVVEGTLAMLDWDTPFRSVAHLVQTGPFGSQLKAHEYQDGGVPVINPSHLAGGRIVADPRVAVSRAKALELARHAFEVGDLAVARRGELGRCAVVDESAEGFLCGTGSAMVRLDLTRVVPTFVARVFGTQRNRDALALASVGSTMDNLNADIIGSLRIPLPAPDEQRRIVAHLDRETGKINDLVAETERFIELARERRSALITAAVTGQIDFRGEVA
jgi:type I restriction enzyme S subunit